MRFQAYILAAISSLLLFSCKKDFLQRDPGVPIDYDKLFSDPKLAAGFGDNSYNFLINDYARFVGAHQGTTGEFTDEAISNTGLAPVSVMTNGQFLSPNAFDVINPYTTMYRGIRNANVMMANIEKVPWTSIYNPEYIRGEQLFLRAFFYFELLKRYGGVVILDKAQTVDESGLDLARATFDETLAFIIRDLDAAVKILPAEWSGNYFGRATTGAAMALKARALLYAASPLNNTGSDNSKWKTAADASKAIIDLNKYSLEPSYSNVLFANNSPEYIMISIKAPRDFNASYINDFIVPPSMGGAQSLISPTQNHVDLYEMKNGKPIADPTSGYNPQQPYVNRDPRFYNNIIYNDQTWIGRKVETFTGGRDVSATTNIYTKTGYYLKRLWPEVLRKAGDKAVVNYIYFRYAEVLLNYAEALNEVEGPTIEVFKAINAVRSRAGMPALPATLTKEQMRQRIRNERAVEFAFEDMRWWDLLRWKQGPTIVTQPMTGMQITKSGSTFSYSVFTLSANYQKAFQDYMHLYPIPQTEIFKSSGALKQNPNW